MEGAGLEAEGFSVGTGADVIVGNNSDIRGGNGLEIAVRKWKDRI